MIKYTATLIDKIVNTIIDYIKIDSNAGDGLLKSLPAPFRPIAIAAKRDIVASQHQIINALRRGSFDAKNYVIGYIEPAINKQLRYIGSAGKQIAGKLFKSPRDLSFNHTTLSLVNNYKSRTGIDLSQSSSIAKKINVVKNSLGNARVNLNGLPSAIDANHNIMTGINNVPASNLGGINNMAGFFTGELNAVQAHLADVLTTGVKLNGKYAFKLMKFNNMNVASGDFAGFNKGNTELLINITKAAQNGMKFGGRLVSQPGRAAKVFQAVGRLNPTEMSDLTTTYSQIMKQGIDTHRAFQNIAAGGNFSKDQMTVLQAMMGNINVGKAGDSAFAGKGQMFSDFDATSAEGKKLLDVGQASAKFWTDHPFLRSLRNGWNSFISYIGKIFGTIGRWFSAAGKYLSGKFNVLKNSGLGAFFKGNTWYENGVCILIVLAITGFLCWGAYKLYQIMFKKRQQKKNATVKESYIRTLNRQSFIEAKNVAGFLKENTSMSKKECNKVANYVYKSSLNRKINNLI